jgi:hypothetical protein
MFIHKRDFDPQKRATLFFSPLLSPLSMRVLQEFLVPGRGLPPTIPGKIDPRNRPAALCWLHISPLF